MFKTCGLSGISQPSSPLTMPAVTEPAAKKRSGKRNTKTAWRKHADTAEVEANLQDLRDQERIGGAGVDVQQDASLFTIDTTGCATTRQKVKNKRLKIDEILTPDSAIAGFRSRLVVKHEPKEVGTKNARLVAKLAEKRKRAGAPMVKPKKRAKPTGMDIWGADAEPQEDPLPEGLDPDMIAPAKPQPVKKPVLPPNKLRKNAAVAVALPGASYNPAFDAHQDALRVAVDAEIKKEESKEAVAKRLAYPPELDLIDDETFFGDEDDEEEEPTVVATEEALAPTASRRKTKAERNKEKRLRAQARAEEDARAERKLTSEIHAVGAIDKAIVRQTKAQEKAAKARQERAEQESADPERVRVGRVKFVPEPVDVQLTEDLADSLRRLKPEGNLFKDRFKSLQARNLIEPRVPVSVRRRYCQKVVETHDYKRFV